MKNARSKHEIIRTLDGHTETYNRLADNLKEHNINIDLLSTFVETLNYFHDQEKEVIYKKGLDEGFKTGWLSAEKYSLIIREKQKVG